jgi:phospholipid transport system substrate-binding protein
MSTDLFFTANGRRNAIRMALFVLALVLAAPIPDASATSNPVQARKLIEDLTQQALSILKTEKGDIDARERKFRTVLTEYFAMRSISRRVAGKHWQEMSPQQQVEFQQLFSEWVLKTYARRFGGYQGESIDVQKASAVGNDAVLVQTKVKGEKRDNKVDWRLTEENKGQLKIVDVSVDGVSMLVAQKSEVSSIVKNKGVDGLLATLRQHTQ